MSKVHDRKGFSQSVEMVSSANETKTRQWLVGDKDCAKQTWCMGRSVARFTFAFSVVLDRQVSSEVLCNTASGTFMVAGDPCCGGLAYSSSAFFLNQSLHSSEIATFQTRNSHDPRSLITPLYVSEKSTSVDMETCSHQCHLESKSLNSVSPKQTFPVPGIAPEVKAWVKVFSHGPTATPALMTWQS